MFIEPKNVTSFWHWFESISNELYTDSSNTKILQQLDNRVTAMGPFDWELGPVDDRLLYLAISPNLNAELLKATTKIISLAPSCEGWWFLYAKPKKEYSPILNLVNEIGRSISIDISTWMYVLYYFEDGTFDIDIRLNSIEGSAETQKLAIDIALTNLLGEERYMTLFKGIKIVTDFGENENRATLIRHISDHVDKVLN